MSAYSIALPFYTESAKEKLEPVFRKYKKDDLQRFDQMFSIMVDELETSHYDFLGEIYMLLEMGNARTGQFFTPYHLSLAIAMMNLGDVKSQLQDKEFITIAEPACGSGGMIIAVREVLLNQGCNPSTDIYVEMTDVDELCFMMSYIQIALYGIAARVIHGNSLSMEIYREMFTPVYFLNNFHFKRVLAGLVSKPEHESLQDETEEVPDRPAIVQENLINDSEDPADGQLNLFQ